MRELYFEAREDKVDGGYVASAIGYGIHTQADTLEELRGNILDAVGCYFDEPRETPTSIHLRVIGEEVLVLSKRKPDLSAAVRGTQSFLSFRG